MLHGLVWAHSSPTASVLSLPKKVALGMTPLATEVCRVLVSPWACPCLPTLFGKLGTCRLLSSAPQARAAGLGT